jgi:hypothetical protein
VPNQNLLGQVHPETDALGTSIVLQFAAHRQEARIVASDDLVLDEPLLERMGLLERPSLLLKHFEEILVDLLRRVGIGHHH